MILYLSPIIRCKFESYIYGSSKSPDVYSLCYHVRLIVNRVATCRYRSTRMAAKRFDVIAAELDRLAAKIAMINSRPFDYRKGQSH